MPRKRRQDTWKTLFCPFCAIKLARCILLNYRRSSKKCSICGHSIREMNEHEFSDDAMYCIEKVFAKANKFPPVTDKEYRVPQRFVDHMKHVQANRNAVLLDALANILTDEGEYQKFKAFVDNMKKQGKWSP